MTETKKVEVYQTGTAVVEVERTLILEVPIDWDDDQIREAIEDDDQWEDEWQLVDDTVWVDSADIDLTEVAIAHPEAELSLFGEWEEEEIEIGGGE